MSQTCKIQFSKMVSGPFTFSDIALWDYHRARFSIIFYDELIILSNARPHSVFIVTFIDLVPNNFFLSLKMKMQLKGRKSHTTEKTQEESQR